MLVRQLLFGLIVGIFACNPQESSAQGIFNVPRFGSASNVNSNAFDRTVDFGPLAFSQGGTNSRSVTKANGGLRNGGSTSVLDSNSLNGGFNVGGLDIGSTVTRTQSRNNGFVTGGGLEHDLNVGNYGVGTSFSPENLQKGFGLRQNPNGDVSLGLGLLNVGLTDRAQPINRNALTQAQVKAQGEDARARARGKTFTNNQQVGFANVRDTFSNSRAAGRTKFGQTTADFLRPKRRAVFVPFIYPDDDSLVRVRRQFGGFRGFGGQPGWNGGFNQQAGANSHNNNKFDPFGYYGDNGASSIGSNLANDGSRGQLSSANTAQMNRQNAMELFNSNNAQSQSLNFDPTMQQATSTNTGTEHFQGLNSERIKSNSGSQASNNNPFGTSSNIANTNSGIVRDGNSETVTSDASGQSIFQGANGGNSGAFTNSHTSSINRPGFQSNSASSSAQSVNMGGGNANAAANAAAGGNQFGRGQRRRGGNFVYPG